MHLLCIAHNRVSVSLRIGGEINLVKIVQGIYLHWHVFPQQLCVFWVNGPPALCGLGRYLFGPGQCLINITCPEFGYVKAALQDSFSTDVWPCLALLHVTCWFQSMYVHFKEHVQVRWCPKSTELLNVLYWRYNQLSVEYCEIVFQTLLVSK